MITGQVDIYEAIAAKEAAIDQVEANASVEWKEVARGAVEILARDHKFFTTDDVWRILDLTELKPHEPRAMGAIMRWAVEMRIIGAAGYYQPSKRKENHRRPLAVWQSRIVSNA